MPETATEHLYCAICGTPAQDGRTGCEHGALRALPWVARLESEAAALRAENERLQDRLTDVRQAWEEAEDLSAHHLKAVTTVEDRSGFLEEALREARAALHRLCLERGSTEGYRDAFAAINSVLDRSAPTGGNDG